MKLGIFCIVGGALMWLWLISGAPHNLSIGQWIASIAILGMFIWPGVIITREALSDRRKSSARKPPTPPTP
jgi:hypothetical protein